MDEEGELKENLKYLTFIQRVFCNWKDTTERFRHHEGSKCHKDGLQVLIVLLKSTRNIGESLSSVHMRKKEDNQNVLEKVIQNIKFFGRQSIAA